MIHVSVPNVGVVAFPDDFTPERIDAEIRQNFADKLGLQDQPAPIVPEATEAPGLFDQATRAVKGFFDDNNIRSAPASVSDSGYSSPITGVFKDLATPGPSTQYDEQNEAVSKRVGNMPARMLRAGAGGMEAAGNLGNYQLPPKAESLSDLAAMPAQAALKFWDSLLGKAIPEDTKDNLKRDAQFLREATNDELQQNAANPAPGLPTLVTDTAGAVADMVPFIATGSAPLALGGMSAYAGGSKYADYIEQGKTPQQALHAGISTALAEGLSEKIPVSAILKKGQGKEWFDAIFGEGLQEGFMSLFEQTYDKTHLDNLSFADAVRNIDWNDAAYQAVIGSTVGGTLKTAATPVQALQQSAIDQQRNDQNRQQNSEALALLDQVIQANNQQQPARDAAAQQQANNALRDKIKQDLATREERAWQKPPGTQPALVGETVIEPQVVRKIPVVPDEQITAPGQGATAYPLGQGTQNPPLVLEDMRQPKTPEQYAEGLYKPQSQAKVSDTDIQQPEQKQALASDTKPDVVTQPVTKAGAEMMGKPQGGAVSEDNNSVEPKDKDGFTYRVTRLNNGRQVRSRVFSEQEALDILRAVETGDKNKIDALLPTNNHRYDFRRQGNKFHGSIQVDDRFTAPGKLHPVAVTIGGAEILKSNAKPTVEKTGAERKSFDTQPTQPAKESRSTPVETAKTEKIEDFGEVLQGARKHVYSLSETLDQAIDIKAEPLSKSFPKPDNEKLSAEGMDNRTIYAVNRLRKEIPNKPRASYRIEGWVRNTETTRNLVNSVMKGEVKPEDSLGPSHLIKNKYERELMGLVDEASPAQLDRLADFRLSGAHFSLYHGQKDVDKIQVTDTSKKSGFGGMANKTYFDTMEQAREFIRGEINENVSESGQRQTSFDIWRERGKEGVFLGKKIASRKFIELRQFDDVKQAREYIEQNRAQLEKDLKEKRKKKSFRRVDNNPRVGEDYRQGKDITPAEFEKAFGFRGVQFGNYVEDARRQQDLNNAYDGLRDLAGLLNIPTQAISLNGTLGLAFGARGKGGKNPASAHYEPGGKNINLTKKSGAGSLAHEWWHSLDNYFANMDKDSGFMSDRKRPAYIRPDGNFRESTPSDFEVREEVYQAFKEIVRVIQKETGLVERSKEQDGNRTKDYWSTVVEMTARTFENYIIAKAAEQGHQSDYLANIVSEPKAEDAVKEYPYLLAREQPVVTEAFDKLFKTLKTKETDQGVALYKAKKQSQAQSLPESVVRRTVQALAPDVQDQIRIEDDFSALPEKVQREARRQGINGDEVHGAWHNGTLYINRANMRTQLDVERVLFHELTHKGLAVMFRDKGVSEAMGNLYRAMGGPRGFEKMVKEFGVDLSAYGELSDLTTNDRRAVMVEELIAHIGEKGSKDLKTRVRELIGAIRNWLSKLGFKSLAGWLETATPSDLAWLAKAARETGQGKRTAKGNSVRFMVAWHGGPHDHNNFDSNYIGTGEGAQAYGWGHYFASRREVAEWYRKNLSGFKVRTENGVFPVYEVMDSLDEVERRALSLVIQAGGDYDAARAMAEYREEDNEYMAALDFLEGEIEFIGDTGKLYQVNLAPSEDEYLLWDEPIGGQSIIEKIFNEVKDGSGFVLVGKGKAAGIEVDGANLNTTGAGLYQYLASDLGGQKAASKALYYAGIRGIKYLDGSSRRKGEGAYNYVIFDDADIEITAKFSAKKQQPTHPQQDADAAREAAEKITSAAEFIESLKGKGKQAIAKSLALLPRLALEEAGRNLLPEISHYVDIAQKMDADKVHNMEHVLRPEYADQPLSDDDLINKPELFFDVNDIADAWRKLPKPVARAMAELMHDATIEGADPAERFTLKYNPNTIDEQIKAAEIHAKRMAREGGNETEMQELRRLRMLKITEARRREKWEALKPRWNALPSEAKQIYRDVRDAYAGRWEQIKQALEERIERADIGGKGKRKLINQLRLQFETAKVEGPYFPLARFGDFWVRAEKTGEEAIFSLAESEYAAKRWVQEMNARGYKAKFGRKLENAPQLEGASISFVTGIHDILAQVPGSQADKVADAVNQLYLQTLPALSIRKSFIHRGKVAGYSQDALRAFSHQMFHGGSQLAKLRYSDQLDDSIQAMKKQIEQASDPVLAASFYEEMVQRNEWAQNPKNARFTTFTSQAAFLWYLTTPAAAVINTTQTALVAYPVLAAKYGEVQTSKALTRAMADFMRGQGHIEEKLSGDERNAILQLIRDGVIDRTQAHTLAELADTDTSQYSAARHRAMSVVSWLFHHTERFNREVTALAAYRLARGKGGTHETAKKAARDAVYDSHFDYSNANRARFMQGDVMKMLTIFRQYSLNMTWLMLKKTYDAKLHEMLPFVRGDKTVQRKEARRFLANFAGMSFLLSGVLGLPLIQQLLDMAQALFGDDDDDHIDADALFRQYLVEATGSKTAGELIAKGPLNVVTGLDFHTRTKLTELWHRSPGKDLEAKAWWMDLMGQIAGPFWNIPVDMAIGAQMINEGHYQRGVEKMLPRALGALSKTERFATDGAENMRGDKLQDKFTAWELIGQAFGFTPAHLADRYDENNAKRRAVSRIDQQRYDLMNYFALAIRMGDEEARGRVLKKIQDFNRRHPHRQINGDSLKRSMLGKAKRSATGDHGFYASPRQSVGVRDIDFAAER